MNIQCELQENHARPAMAIRTRTSVANLPQVLGEGFGKVAGHLGELGAFPAGAPFVAYFSMDMEDLDIEIGFPVSGQLPGKGDIQASQIPGGKQASCMYTGPYEQMPPAYEALTKLVAEQGYDTTGVSYEFYLNDPGETPPEDLQTQIIFPLK